MGQLVRGKFGETIEGFPPTIPTFEGIFGMNFNGKNIPPAVRRLFPQRLDEDGEATRALKASFSLQAVCRSKLELEVLMAAADNGKRKFYVRTRGLWMALYIGG